jgi:hypothetical protein
VQIIYTEKAKKSKNKAHTMPHASWRGATSEPTLEDHSSCLVLFSRKYQLCVAERAVPRVCQSPERAVVPKVCATAISGAA